MPQMNDETAEKVANAESTGGSREPVPAGRYEAKLLEVESRDGRKAPYWSWKFEIVEPVEHAGHWVWENTSLSENAAWKLKQAFDAFGVPTTTHTDELIGKVIGVWIGTETQSQGQGIGTVRNTIEEFLLPGEPPEVEAF